MKPPVTCLSYARHVCQTRAGPNAGTCELARFSAVRALLVWAVRRPWRGHSPAGRPRRPTHATNSLSTRKLSLNLLPGSPCREAGKPLGDTLTLSRRGGLPQTQQRGGQNTLDEKTLGGRTQRERNRTRTNATHKLYARNTVDGGTCDQTLRNARRTRGQGVRCSHETREQHCAWRHNSTGNASFDLHWLLPQEPRRCSICVPATGSISSPNLLLQGRSYGEKEAPVNIHRTTTLDRCSKDSGDLE
jgi:hypothetical protein